MTTYFYSDPHFGHARILELAKRPFTSIAEHDFALARRYECKVASGDLVIWCGDVSFLGKRAEGIMRALPGHKVLCLGNHDISAASMAKRGFDAVVDSLTMHIAGHPVVVSHYPYQGYVREDGYDDVHRKHCYQPFVKGQAIIHGHTHSTVRVCGTAINVCVEAWDYGPVPITEIETLINKMF